MNYWQSFSTKFRCPNCPIDPMDPNKTNILYVNQKKDNEVKLSNRTWCSNCTTINNPEHLKEFYEKVITIPVLPIKEQLDQMIENIKGFKNFKTMLFQQINKHFEEFEKEYLEVHKEFYRQYLLFDIHNVNYDLTKLQQLVHLIYGDGLKELYNKTKQLDCRSAGFYDGLTKILDTISNLIKTKDIVYQPRKSIFQCQKKQWEKAIQIQVQADILTLASEKEGNYFASGGLPLNEEDDSSHIWTVEGQYVQNKLYGAHSFAVNQIIISDEGYIISAGNDMTIKEGHKWQEDSPYLFSQLKKNEGKSITSLHLDSSGQFLLNGNSEGQIIIWKREGDIFNEVAQWKVVDTLDHHISSVTLLQMSKEQAYIISGTSNTDLTIWENIHGKWKIKQILQIAQDEEITALCNIDRSHFLFGTSKGFIYIYESQGRHFQELYKSTVFDSQIKEVYYNEILSQVLILGMDSFKIFEKVDFLNYVEVFHCPGSYSCITFSKNGQIIAAYTPLNNKQLHFFRQGQQPQQQLFPQPYPSFEPQQQKQQFYQSEYS